MRVSLDAVRERYAAKLVLGFAAVVIVLAAIGGYIYLNTGSALASDAEQELESRADQHAAQLERWVANSKHTAQRLAATRVVATEELGRIQTYFSTQVLDGKLTSGARAIHYIDTSTTEILTSSLQRRVGGNPRAEGAPWAQSSLAEMAPGDVRVTAFNPDVANATVMTFVTPVPGQDRAIVYVTSLGGVTEELRQPSNRSYTVVVHDSGTTVINQRAPETVGDPYGVESPAIRDGLEGNSTFARVGAGQTPGGYGDVVMGFGSVTAMNWTVMTNAPASEVFALRQTISLNLIALLGAAVLGLGAVGLTLGRNTLSSLRDLTAKARAMEAGDLDVDLGTDRRDEIGDLFRTFEAMRDSLEEQIQQAERAREEAEESQQAAEAAKEEADEQRRRSEDLVDHLEAKASDYRAVMEATAAGDLTRRMDPESESEAMRQIAEAFNGMAEDLADTVAEINGFASEVATSSTEATTGTEEIEAASHEVSQSIQEISMGVEDQTDKLQEVAGEMQSLSGSIEEVASSADQVAATASAAAEEGSRGQAAAQEAISEMNQIEATTAATVDEVEDLAAEIDEIGEIVELITEITEQTNLLALNASIEAARAGEAGEGFAVVADEIKSLAADAATATEEIEERIEAIQARTDATVGDITEMRGSVVSGMDTVEDALSALEEVVDEVEEANRGMQEINQATDDQAASTEEVVAMVDEVTTVANRNSAEAESVSAAAEEQTSALSEVSTTVESLSQRATELQTMLSDFETGAEDLALDQPGSTSQIAVADGTGGLDS